MCIIKFVSTCVCVCVCFGFKYVCDCVCACFKFVSSRMQAQSDLRYRSVVLTSGIVSRETVPCAVRAPGGAPHLRAGDVGVRVNILGFIEIPWHRGWRSVPASGKT